MTIQFNASAYVDSVLREAEEALRKHYRSFLPQAYESVKKLAVGSDQQELIATMKSFLDDRSLTTQSRADKIQMTIYRLTRISIIERGKGGNRGGQTAAAASNFRRNAYEDKKKSNENINLLVPVSTATLSQIAVPGNPPLDSLVSLDELEKSKKGVALANRREAIKYCTDGFVAPHSCAILVLAEPGEHYFGSKEVAEKYKVSRAAVEFKAKDGSADPELNRTRIVWIVNFGEHPFVAEIEQIPAPEISEAEEIIEISVRCHESSTDATFFQALKEHPVKMMTQAVQSLFTPEIYDKCERISKAYVKKHKPGEIPTNVIQGFVRAPKSLRETIYTLSGQGGLVFSTSKGRDQEYGFSVVQLPQGTTMDEYNQWHKNVGEELFKGMVPLTRDWDVIGLRFLTKDYEQIKQTLSQGPPDMRKIDMTSDASNSRYVVTAVPKTWSQNTLKKWLQSSLDWTITVIGEARGVTSQDCTNYLVGAMQAPKKSIVNFGGAAPIEIKEEKGKLQPVNKIARWATRAVAGGRSPATTALVQQAEPPAMDGDNGSDISGMTDDDNFSKRLNRLGRDALRSSPYQMGNFQKGGASSSSGGGKATAPFTNLPGMSNELAKGINPAYRVVQPQRIDNTTDFQAAVDNAVRKKFEQVEADLDYRLTAVEMAQEEMKGDIRETKKSVRKTQSSSNRMQQMIELLCTKSGIQLPPEEGDSDEESREGAGKKAKTT
eukprot:TRINITY_DN24257_c0_g1_i1.p1 TRINITY_DN24257_c0_g1~~TRINITY_DN24257_c0_g1_i1.p1  ORF type:complete len:720 (+),score=95.13 TRINITY_DN24257_c0_g1_i1:309-2468(+)